MSLQTVSASFRDPSGYIFRDGDTIVRTINSSYSEHWDHGIASGLLDKLLDREVIVAFSEHYPLPGSWKSLQVERIPFISYPYEWSFSQLKDAALLTLDLQKEALRHGMTVKDASAFNVQFVGSSIKFIDLLSFEKWEEGTPWAAYRQFCSHFLAPLTLSRYSDIRCGSMSRLWIDGIPLDLCCSLLPKKTLLYPRLLWHLHLHAKMQSKHADVLQSQKDVKKVKVSDQTLEGIATSLEKVVRSLELKQDDTEWANYYDDTNYSDSASTAKKKFVEQAAAVVCGGGKLPLAIDLGANTGEFSRCISQYFDYVLAPDIDPCAVDKHYRFLKQNNTNNILPIVLDLANVSPALGWGCIERDSFDSRCKANFINALALIHHLAITAGIPLHMISDYISTLLADGGTLLIEFVPKEDSQVRRMLSTREDIFEAYNVEGFKKAFSENFTIEATFEIPETVRTLFVMRKRGK